jgi:hypothetical protein
MKLFQTRTPKEKREDLTEWLKRPDEEVYIYFPRFLEDGSLRMFETVVRKTAIEYAYDSVEKARGHEYRVFMMCVPGPHKTYNYYPK